METNEAHVVETSRKEPKTNWVMAAIAHEDGGPTSLVQFEEIEMINDRSGMGNKIYRARRVYPYDNKDIPDVVAVKASNGIPDIEKRNRTAVERLVRIANIAGNKSRLGSLVFPIIFAVNDPNNGGSGTFSYAMEYVDPKDFIDPKDVGPDVKSLIEMAVVYADACEIMNESSIWQIDRKLDDFSWNMRERSGKIVDWDAQASIQETAERNTSTQRARQSDEESKRIIFEDEIKRLKDNANNNEIRRLGKILLRTIGGVEENDIELPTTSTPQGARIIKSTMEKMLFETVPGQIAQLVKDLVEVNFGSLEEVKLAALQIREQLKQAAETTFLNENASALEERLIVLKKYNNNPKSRWMLAVAKIAVEQKSRNPHNEDKFDAEYTRLLAQVDQNKKQIHL